MKIMNIRFSLNENIEKEKIIIEYIERKLFDTSNSAIKQKLYEMAIQDLNGNNQVNNIPFNPYMMNPYINNGNIINGNNNIVDCNKDESININDDPVDDYSDVMEMLDTFDF